jgi:hypothetical protein
LENLSGWKMQDWPGFGAIGPKEVPGLGKFTSESLIFFKLTDQIWYLHPPALPLPS